MTQNSPTPSGDDLDAVVNDNNAAPELQVREFDPPEPPQKLPDTTVKFCNNNEAGKCFRCDSASINFCRHCGQEFCSTHASRYSTGTCYLCIAPNNLGIEFEPLVEEEIDAEGKTTVHHGRRIKLIGEGWPNSMQMIETMTDEGLEIFIAERKRLLNEAVKLGEYHRITLAAAEFKKEYNRRSKIAKLRRRREELIQQGTLRVDGKAVNLSGAKQRSLTPNEKLMKALGLNPEQFKAFKKLMAK